MSSNLPPGVSPNDPHITGIWPAEQVIDGVTQDLEKAKNSAVEEFENAISNCEDQGLSFSKAERNSHDDAIYDIEAAFDGVIDDINSRLPDEDY